MSYDISTELDIIENEERGETVRDAIVEVFRKMNTASLGVMITTEEWESLTEEEKNNGTTYFVSDLDIVDGTNYYFDGETESASHLFVSFETCNNIIKALKQKFNIKSPIRLEDVSKFISLYDHVSGLNLNNVVNTFIGTFYMNTEDDWINANAEASSFAFISPYLKVLTACYINSPVWIYSSSSNKKNVIDVFELQDNEIYLLLVRKNALPRHYTNGAFFQDNPIDYLTDVRGNTSISFTSITVDTFMYNAAIIQPLDGYRYVAVETSRSADFTSQVFAVKINSIFG